MAAKKQNDVFSNDNANEPAVKRTRQKINSVVMALQREHALYDHVAATRFAAISDRIDNVNKQIENLRLDMAECIHQEFIYLFNKIMLTAQKPHADNNNLAEIDYGGKT